MSHMHMNAYYKGERLEELEELFKNGALEDVGVALWTTSEIGEQAMPLKSYVLNYLGHDDPYIAYYAVSTFVHLYSYSDDDSIYIEKIIKALTPDLDTMLTFLILRFLSGVWNSLLRSLAKNSSDKELGRDLEIIFNNKVMQPTTFRQCCFLIVASYRSVDISEQMDTILTSFDHYFLKSKHLKKDGMM